MDFVVNEKGTLISINYENEKEIIIPAVVNERSVTKVGSVTFANCTNLTSVTIPDTVVSIGTYAFKECPNLDNINVDINNKNYSSQNGILFNKNKTELIQYPMGNTKKSYQIPEGVIIIQNSAFEGCSNLESITIPNSVTNIGIDAFANCSNLENVVIPNSITSIYSATFANCKKLKNITIPDSVRNIKNYAFVGCINLKSVNIPAACEVAENAFD